MEHAELQSVIESLLFSAKKPVTLAQLTEWFAETDTSEKDLGEILVKIRTDYECQERGVRLVEVAEGYQFRTPRQNGPWIRKSFHAKSIRLSAPSLEVLAIVAYKQPVTRSEIEAVRGVDSSHLLKTLMERNLIAMIGKTDDPGRPVLYSTTPEFLEFFSIKSIRDLPTLRDLDELSAFGDTHDAQDVSPDTAVSADSEDSEPSGEELPSPS